MAEAECEGVTKLEQQGGKSFTYRRAHSVFRMVTALYISSYDFLERRASDYILELEA